MSELAEYTSKIEELLEEQKKENSKLKKIQMVQSGILIFFVVVFTIGIIAVNVTVKKVTKDVPKFVDTATVSVDTTAQELQSVLEEIKEIDFENLNKTIEDAGRSINSIDVESLNNSVEALEQVVTKLARFFGVK